MTEVLVQRPTEPVAAKKARHYPGLDGVRGIALLGVLLVHASEGLLAVLPADLVKALTPVLEFGVYGVDLFFVLSGFLITGILLRAKSSARYFQTFYARRMLRLAPLYFGYLVLIGVGLRLLHRATHSTMADYQGSWWWYLLYVSNWKSDHGAPDPFLGHFWSLAVEEQFYLAWPLLVFILSRRGLAWLCAGLIGLAGSSRVLLAMQGADWVTLYRSTYTRVDTLAFGALVALALTSKVWKPLWTQWYRTVGLAAATGLLALIVYAGGPNWTTHPIQIGAPVLSSLCFMALITFAVQENSRVLEQPWLRAWGKYSYAGYVLHPLFFGYIVALESWLFRKWNWYPFRLGVGVGFYFGDMVLIFLVARWSWNHFEGPIQNWKERRFTSRQADGLIT